MEAPFLAIVIAMVLAWVLTIPLGATLGMMFFLLTERMLQ